MAQHFLLSPECRTLTVMYLGRVSEAKAYAWFKQARWFKTQGKPSCPDCGTLRCYEMTRSRFKCSDGICKKVFTVTSGTAFAFRNLSFKKMLIAIWFAANSVKGKAALQLSREIGVQFKTTWVLLMKLREVVAARRETMRIGSDVEIDGKYIGGHVRKKNKAKDRVDRRLKEDQNPNRLCARAIRGRAPGSPTFTRVMRNEDGEAAWRTEILSVPIQVLFTAGSTLISSNKVNTSGSSIEFQMRTGSICRR